MFYSLHSLFLLAEKKTEMAFQYLTNKENIFLIAYQSPLGLDKRPVLSVHFIIETTGIAEIVTIAVPPPQRCRGRPAVHTFSSL